MKFFSSQNNQLYIEKLPLEALAKQFDTPLYAYSRAALEANLRAYQAALRGQPHRVCFAVKANGNLAVLNVLAQMGAGFDIVSQGELERVLAAGGDPQNVVFSGVGKQAHEIRRALEAGIHAFNIESQAELELLDHITRQTGLAAHVSLRVNPDVNPQTHPYIATGLRESKFGLDIEDAKALYRRAQKMPHLHIRGVACHIGSQITSLAPFMAAFERTLQLSDALAEMGIELDEINIGGGLGVTYRDEAPPAPGALIAALRDRLDGRPLKLILEPGRSIAAGAGVLLTRVIAIKETPAKNFAIVDAAMNDLLRPALYGAWHEILPVEQRPGVPRAFEIVGPVCESSDTLGKERWLDLRAGDLLAVMNAGAYGMTMASNYNARPRPAEVMVSDEQAQLVRGRESYADLMHGERIFTREPHPAR